MRQGESETGCICTPAYAHQHMHTIDSVCIFLSVSATGRESEGAFQLLRFLRFDSGDQSCPQHCDLRCLYTVEEYVCSSGQYAVCTQNASSWLVSMTGLRGFSSCQRFQELPGVYPLGPELPQPSPARRPIPAVSRPFRVVFIVVWGAKLTITDENAIRKAPRPVESGCRKSKTRVAAVQTPDPGRIALG